MVSTRQGVSEQAKSTQQGQIQRNYIIGQDLGSGKCFICMFVGHRVLGYGPYEVNLGVKPDNSQANKFFLWLCEALWPQVDSGEVANSCCPHV